MVLLHQNTPPPRGAQATAKKISGRKLSRKRISPIHLALLAADLVKGEVEISNLTPTQASGLTGASVGYVHTASKLTPEEREDVKRGRASLSQFHNREPSDARLDRIVRKYPQRIMQALDRYTQPPLPLAAE
jgi:hypothetical protein